MVRFAGVLQLMLSTIMVTTSLVNAVPMRRDTTATASTYWVNTITRQGTVAFGSNSSYDIYRNVMDFGAKGMFHSSFL